MRRRHARAALAVLLVLAPAACHRKPRPSFEYEPRVTTTSDVTTTTVPPFVGPVEPASGWKRGKSW